ncbi:hypothetical protein F0562_024043 [Nyssa sinensis]|uniref:Uncharacterized protein n=1 Tax=Nyssa sinensis TaxID=561372 RepID=A0A5J5BP03_9ASTE|nr:hypothetical protein F0562_024043 [Nyssa sinensis]
MEIATRVVLKRVIVQPTASTETIQLITQHATPTRGGTLTYSHSASSIGLRGTGHLATIPEIMPTVAGQAGVACPLAKISCSDIACSCTPNISIQGQDSSFADMDQPLLPKPIATQRAALIGGGTLTHSHPASSIELRGTGPIASLPEIAPTVVNQEGRLTDAPITIGHSSNVNSCAVTVKPQFTTLASPSSMDKIDASQHDGRVSPSARVACPSAKFSYPNTACASTPNISLQSQALSTTDIDQPPLLAPIARFDSTVGKSYQLHFVHPTRVGHLAPSVDTQSPNGTIPQHKQTYLPVTNPVASAIHQPTAWASLFTRSPLR